ncbi:MAG TPA: cytochrome c [Bryobacteraceae bacterium]|nr:cytochrome c [Bryobacteraceae bacterium]
MKNSASIPICLILLAACRQDMHDQPKYKPLAASQFFADGRSARPAPAFTIARDQLADTDEMHTGAAGGAFLASIPVPVDAALLSRGRQRFDIYCSPCHGRIGNGDGMIARRGFKAPADLNSVRVRRAPPGYIFQVIRNGYGAMGDYRDQVSAADAWAIVAYIRALELSRGAILADVPDDQRAHLEAQP